MKVTIDGTTELKEGVIWANISPSDIRLLSDQSNKNVGETSIISLANYEDKKRDSKNRISFSPNAATVINIGSTDKTIILLDKIISDDDNKKVKEVKPNREFYKKGDKKFLTDLPEYLEDLGSKLLKTVRQHFKGELIYKETSRKFVESPDNFWVVKIQPRDRSLRLTVRGVPNKFPDDIKFEIKPDMSGYSTFKISQISEIKDAVRVIRKASQI